MIASDVSYAILEATTLSALSVFQQKRIRRIMTSPFRPIARRNITDRITTLLLADELLVVTDTGVEPAVDMAKIIEAIMKWLPMILQLIALFA